MGKRESEQFQCRSLDGCGQIQKLLPLAFSGLKKVGLPVRGRNANWIINDA